MSESWSMSIDRTAPRPDPATAVPPIAAHALVVIDDPSTREEASLPLRNAGIEVIPAADGLAALRSLQSNTFDLVVLDMMLAGGSSIELLRAIRVVGDTPVVLLGAGDSEVERILGLELGADDYITKPFSPLEFASRVRAILRRAQRKQSAPPTHCSVGLLRVDLRRHEVLVGERAVDVTPSEFRVIALLASSAGTVFTRRKIMEHVWGGRYFGDGHPVDMHVLNLRRKIEDDPRRPRRLMTVRGVGFKLVAPACEAT